MRRGKLRGKRRQNDNENEVPSLSPAFDSSGPNDVLVINVAVRRLLNALKYLRERGHVVPWKKKRMKKKRKRKKKEKEEEEEEEEMNKNLRHSPLRFQTHRQTDAQMKKDGRRDGDDARITKRTEIYADGGKKG